MSRTTRHSNSSATENSRRAKRASMSRANSVTCSATQAEVGERRAGRDPGFGREPGQPADQPADRIFARARREAGGCGAGRRGGEGHAGFEHHRQVAVRTRARAQALRWTLPLGVIGMAPKAITPPPHGFPARGPRRGPGGQPRPRRLPRLRFAGRSRRPRPALPHRPPGSRRRRHSPPAAPGGWPWRSPQGPGDRCSHRAG